MIERVGPGHARVLAALHASAFAAPDTWNEAAFASLLASPGCWGLIDDRGGCALIRAVAEEAEVLTIAVAPPARRQGVAAALVRRSVEILQDAGVEALFLEVAETNMPARALYTGCRFVEVGRRPAYYGATDALILRRAFDRPR